MERLESMVPPSDMWKGSRGTMANIWLVALKVWARAQHIPCDMMVVDGVFGEVGATLTKAFQQFHGLETDGGVGPATRARADQVLGFNFDAVAACTPGETLFVLADGSEVLWTLAPSELVTTQ